MKRTKVTDYYELLNKELENYELNKPYHRLNIHQIADKIDWCWKWRKITKEQMEELADRATVIFERQARGNNIW